VLRKVYKIGPAQIVDFLREIMAAPNLLVEHRDEILRALDAPVIFADALIHFTGKTLGASRTLTFDKKFAHLDGVELLGS
jgi:predicted nucleic-acid-binding protein